MVRVKWVPCYSHGVPENDRKSRFDESCGKLHQNFRADVRQMFGQSNISTSSATRCSNVSQVHQNISHAALKFPRKSWLFRQASSHPDYSHGLRGCCLALGTSRSVQKCQPLGQTWMARWHDGWCSNYSMNLTALLKISDRSFVENKYKCFLCEVGNLLRELARPTWANLRDFKRLSTTFQNFADVSWWFSVCSL